MKKILLIILLLITANSFSQNELSGKFCNPPIVIYSSECIQFLDNDRFTYKVSGHNSEEFGKGNYQLSDDELRLVFDKDSVEYQSSIKIEDIAVSNNNDSIDIVFKIMEKAHPEEPLPAQIFQESDSFEFDKRKHTDNNGRLTLRKSKNNKTERYRVVFLGLEPFEFDLKHDGSKKVTIELAPAPPRVISDQTIIYKLKEIASDKFVTEQGDEYIKVEQ